MNAPQKSRTVAKHENPPAFPNTGNITWNLHPADGMSLRDYFAAEIAAGDMASQSESSGFYDNDTADEFLLKRAQFIYRFADAMLAERAKVPA